MKKLILLLALTAIFNFTEAQLSQPFQMAGKRGFLGDTITNTGSAYDSILINNSFGITSGSIVTVVTKISGTVSVKAIIQGSADGLHWTVWGQDSSTLAPTTGSSAFTWQLPGLPTKSSNGTYATPAHIPWLYIRVLGTGTGTMAAIIKSYYTPR